ncbi:N-acetylmuramoyl-L-alanine amidase [Leucobacter sp. GX24907]
MSIGGEMGKRNVRAAGLAGVMSAAMLASALVAAPAFAESSTGGAESIDGAKIENAPVESSVADPTTSEVSLAPVDVAASYTESAAVPEHEGELQQESLAEEVTSDDAASAGAARVDLNSDIAVFGVTWARSDAEPVRIEYRELAAGEWTAWQEIETEATGEAMGDRPAEVADAPAGSTEPVFIANAEALEVVAFTADGQLVGDLDVTVVDPRGEDPVENAIEGVDDDAAQDRGPAEVPPPSDPYADSAPGTEADEEVAPEEPAEDGSEAPTEEFRDEPVTEGTGTTADGAVLTNGTTAHPALAVKGENASEDAIPATAPSVTTAANVNTGLGLTIKSRAAWGADEGLKFGNSAGECTYGTYKCQIKYTGAVVHHTAGSNNYTQAQVPGLLRGIYYFHAVTQNYGDMGYQLLVDKYGGVWEGRYGSLTKSPFGAQAIGANWQTFGISVLGTYTGSAPTAKAQDSVAKAIAWMFKKHGIKDPKGTTWIPHADNKGRTVPKIMGHRQTMPTVCPGDAFYARLPAIRNKVATYASKLQGKLVAPFSDVWTTDQFATEIAWMSKQGITKGTKKANGTYFAPMDGTTRRAMAAFLYRASGSPSVKLPAQSPFSDVKRGDSFYKEIVWMHQEGLAKGYKKAGSKPEYRPMSQVNRGSMAAFLFRLDSGSSGYKAPATSPFRDVPKSHQFYREISWMRSTGLANGYKHSSGARDYRTGSKVTRQAMAAFLYRDAHR